MAFYIKLAKDGLHVYHPSAGTAGSFTMLTIGKTRLHPSIIENFHLTEVAVNIQATNTQFWLRTGETDQKVFEKVFIKNEYEPRQPYTAKAGDEVRTIIDAGANIGCATVWFKSRFPNARIIAIEPDPSNFEQLNRNCGGIPGVELLLGALWGEDTSLDLQFATGRGSLGSWGTRTLPADTSKVAEMRTLAYTVDTLMQKYSLDTIDCLKIDIEGAEKSVFESIHRDWLAKTAVVVAEFHDRFLPGCTAAADAAMADRIQNKYRRGENWFYHIA
ncbi:FkbM family methyltransferase [Falsiroseomonas ponticola]|uniref:FkbM family methyltransferase n=1 Tax=Falsiroseomonas ponticola TaxID=2786951 RepID=UPI001933BFD6|nr:FkbM family methyltransferase [Roseomonas ponticola]